MLMNGALYLSGAIAIVATFMVITRTNAIHALLYLIVSLLSVALIFYILGAPFVAALEVMIYAGAIMVLFVFVIMILNIGPESAGRERRWLSPEGWAGPACLAAVLLGELIYIVSLTDTEAIQISTIGPKAVGISLFGTYLMGIELASILLLSGLVGAYYIGRRERPENGSGGNTA
jgi:NADH-quinone oxidoreductase subunit J